MDDPGEAVGGTEADAARMVGEWLDLARTRSGDLGWSLIYPIDQRDLIGSFEVYEAAVVAADWTDFAYDIPDVRTTDGEYRVTVRLLGGVESVPQFMLDWGLIQTTGATGTITVRIAPGGFPRGIQGTG